VPAALPITTLLAFFFVGLIGYGLGRTR